MSCLRNGPNVIFNGLVIATLQFTDIDYHVDFVGPISDCLLSLKYLAGRGSCPEREANNGTSINVGALKAVVNPFNPVWVDAY